MERLLVPLSSLSETEAFSSIRANAIAATELLVERYSPGTAASFANRTQSGEQIARENTQRALRQDQAACSGTGTLWHYAVKSTLDADTFVGLASRSKGQSLAVTKLPVPLRIARKFKWLMEHPIDEASASCITGWSTPDAINSISQIYRELIEDSLEADERKIWTIEPVRTRKQIKDAIVAAGLRPTGEAQAYDVGESPSVQIPYSRFYQYRG